MCQVEAMTAFESQARDRYDKEVSDMKKHHDEQVCMYVCLSVCRQ